MQYKIMCENCDEEYSLNSLYQDEPKFCVFCASKDIEIEEIPEDEEY